MKANQYWKVIEVHKRGQYNDPEVYAIFDGNNKEIVRGSSDRSIFDVVVEAHNEHFFTDEQDGGAE